MNVSSSLILSYSCSFLSFLNLSCCFYFLFICFMLRILIFILNSSVNFNLQQILFTVHYLSQNRKRVPKVAHVETMFPLGPKGTLSSVPTDWGGWRVISIRTNEHFGNVFHVSCVHFSVLMMMKYRWPLGIETEWNWNMQEEAACCCYVLMSNEPNRNAKLKVLNSDVTWKKVGNGSILNVALNFKNVEKQ